MDPKNQVLKLVIILHKYCKGKHKIILHALHVKCKKKMLSADANVFIYIKKI